jgi:hypothetical protein
MVVAALDLRSKCESEVQAWEFYEAAHAQGMVVVGGEGRVSLSFSSW